MGEGIPEGFRRFGTIENCDAMKRCPGPQWVRYLPQHTCNVSGCRLTSITFKRNHSNIGSYGNKDNEPEKSLKAKWKKKRTNVYNKLKLTKFIHSYGCRTLDLGGI